MEEFCGVIDTNPYPEWVFVTCVRPHITLAINTETGEAEVDAEGSIVKIQLPNYLSKVIILFAKSPDVVVTNEEFKAEVMRGSAADDSFKIYVGQLRKALGPARVMIRTVPKVGYCLDTY